ncbi:NADPH:quinone reductase [Micractinium conductrix]|uniref:NADPH:quinone reductase n=1 Tax=Micractinium conductrix TaxID=554055 RepID=A0A2P6VBY1_9CHLO|nr:NADPH:quinone reductase [Micractinium conductrix]|eukprot:PSC71602.1 NADPH:quinone reductase [Micractinium conductrix]
MAAAAAPAATRTAVQYDSVGAGAALRVVPDAPVPPRKQGQVLVENKAAGVNPIDYKLRVGFGNRIAQALAGPKLPAIPGGDVAGVVLAADEGSTFKQGDRVMALLQNFVGGYASKVVVPESWLARIPDSLSFEQAAAMPLAALTAWQARTLELARVKAGDRVLVHAGSGGMGTFAIQLAKERGAVVATTCSAHNAEFVKELGADEVCDYAAEAFEQKWAANPFDAVLDTIVLKGYEQRSLQVLKRSGTYVHFMPAPTFGMIAKGFLRGALGLGPRYRVVLVQPNGKQLSQIAALVAEGKVRPVIARTLPLAQAAEAQEAIAKGHTRGKIVLTI